ncbi:MAG: NAD-dependent epimerase/dehydratase family protein [Planctomycetota bacterium]
MPETRRVLVTGASGFIGGGLVRRLLGRGDSVHVLLRPEARLWRLDSIRERLVVHDGNLTDRAAVSAALRAARPDVVVHLAAYGAYESQSDAAAILTTNVVGTWNLLAACQEHGVKLVVNAGSSSEYGWRDEPMRESDRLEPNSLYAVAKAAQTHLCALLSRQHALPVVTFRLFSVYGPWEEPTRLFPTILRRARAGLPLEMVAPETAHDFIYLDDVLDALCGFERLAACRGEVFNLGSGRETTLREVVEVVLRVTGSRSEVHWGAMPARHWDARRWQADVSMTQSTLNWSAAHSLEQGVRKVAAWMEERKHVQSN